MQATRHLRNERGIGMYATMIFMFALLALAAVGWVARLFSRASAGERRLERSVERDTRNGLGTPVTAALLR